MNRKIFSYPYIIWIIGFTIIPLIFIFIKAMTNADGGFTTENILAIFDPIHRKALISSVELAFIATAICILLAYPLALLLRGSKMSSQKLMLFILILPMWMNFILRLLALQMLISNNGIINFVLTHLGFNPLQMINTKGAIVFGMVYDYLPYMILPILNAITAIPEDYIEASKDLGGGRWQTFKKIILPLSLPGVGSGITMVFVPSMTEFVIANILGGGKILLLGNVIEQEFITSMNWNLGSGLSMSLMVFIVITTLLLGNKDSNDRGFAL